MDSYKILWNQSLEIGDSTIDGQHQYLIELIAAIPGAESSKSAEALEYALAYTQTHFSEEEALMRSIDYPLLETHANAHKKLTRILMSYKRQYEAGDEDLYSFREFMYRWVRDHIMENDQKLGVFIREKNT